MVTGLGEGIQRDGLCQVIPAQDMLQSRVYMTRSGYGRHYLYHDYFKNDFEHE